MAAENEGDAVVDDGAEVRTDGDGEATVTPGDAQVAPKRSRSGVWMMRAGAALILVGVLLLGWIAWQFWGTNWLSERKQSEAVEELERAWDDGEDSANLDFGEAEAIIRIPAFGDDYAIPVLAGTSDEALAAGFGHFETSAGPGEVGNYALAGHRITNGEPLRAMPDLRVGDLVIVETRESTFTYTLMSAGDALTVTFTDTWVVDALPTNPDPSGVQPPQETGGQLLTLTTCAELFHTDDRLIAFATLTDVADRE